MASGSSKMLEIIAFKLSEQEFCVRTTSIREIRGWVPATPIPRAPPEVVGVMNLRGMVIPVINLAFKLGMRSTEPSERSAIVVTEVHGMVMGLLVDQVSDILTVPDNLLQPVPDLNASEATGFSEGIIVQQSGMICFLNLDRMFSINEANQLRAA